MKDHAENDRLEAAAVAEYTAALDAEAAAWTCAVNPWDEGGAAPRHHPAHGRGGQRARLPRRAPIARPPASRDCGDH